MIAPINYSEWERELDTAEAYQQFNRHGEQARERGGIVPAVILGLVVGLFFGFMAGLSQ